VLEVAEDVLAHVEAECFDCTGLSMGGIVAMEMAWTAPDRLRRIALIDTNHRADAPGQSVKRNRQVEDVRSGKLQQVIVEEMKPAYLAAASRSKQELLDLLVDMAVDVGTDAFVNQSLALRDRRDQSHALKRFDGPALVLCGAEDTLCPPDRHREIVKFLSDGELEIIAGAGHISTLEQPQAVNTALEKWLSRPTQQGGDR